MTNAITLTEAAKRLGVCTRTVRRRIDDGTLTGYRFGPSLIRLDADEVDAMLRPITASSPCAACNGTGVTA